MIKKFMKKLLLIGFMIITFISCEKESHDHNHDHNDELCCEIVQIQFAVVLIQLL